MTTEANFRVSPLSVEKEMSDLLQRMSSLELPGAYDSDEHEHMDTPPVSPEENPSGLNASPSRSEGQGPMMDLSRVSTGLERSRSAVSSDPQQVEKINDQLSITDVDTIEHTEIMRKHMADMITSVQVHFMDVKRRLIDEKDFAVRSRDTFYTEHLTRQQHIIEKLNSDLSRSEQDAAYEARRLTMYLDRTLSLYCKRLSSHMSPYSVSKIFNLWKGYAAENKRMSQMVKISTKFLRRSLMARGFSAICKEYFSRAIVKRENESKFRFEGTARQMVERYEGEIARLQAESNEAHAALRKEQYRRQQLEEDLRRMFLKNMTVMNMEALSLFQNPCLDPPQLSGTGTSSNLSGILRHEDCDSSGSAHKDQMLLQQQTMQQHRVELNVVRELSKTVPGSSKTSVKKQVQGARKEQEADDLYPRTKLPPQAVKSIRRSDVMPGGKRL